MSSIIHYDDNASTTTATAAAAAVPSCEDDSRIVDVGGDFDRVPLILFSDEIPLSTQRSLELSPLNALCSKTLSYDTIDSMMLLADGIDESNTIYASSSPETTTHPLSRNKPPQRSRRCTTTAPWDEGMDWFKSKKRHRRFRSGVHNSDCGSSSSDTSESSPSTSQHQTLLRPGAAMLQRNVSHSSTTSSSSSLSMSDNSVAGGGLELLPWSDHDELPPAVVTESPNAIFFSPRRRLNSIVLNSSNRNMTMENPILPVTVVSIPTLTDIVNTSSNYEDEIRVVTDEEGNNHDSSTPERCCFFPFFSSQQCSKYQRRNLLLLFLIATYTTFGLASPNIHKAASEILNNNHSKDGNIILIDDTFTTVVTSESSVHVGSAVPLLHTEVLSTADYEDQRPPHDAIKNAAVTDPEKTMLRGGSAEMDEGMSSRTTTTTSRKDASVIHNQLSFARGNGVNHPVLVYRRREMNDFYHQPALLHEDTTVTTSWYLNCFVLFLIAIYYIIREHKRAIVSCRTNNCLSSATGNVHNIHQL